MTDRQPSTVVPAPPSSSIVKSLAIPRHRSRSSTRGCDCPKHQNHDCSTMQSHTQKKQRPGAPRVLRSMSMTLNDGLAPPENFAHVGAGGLVYRSSFPKMENFNYLKKLGLKSILTLVPQDYPEENKMFMKLNGIKHFQIGMSGNKEPFVKIEDSKITEALRLVLDRRNHPILIHCNKGKHRTGCVVGCLRKIQSWSLTLIFDEYRRFADPKSRALDQLFIEMYDEEKCSDFAKEMGWIRTLSIPSGFDGARLSPLSECADAAKESEATHGGVMIKAR